MLARLQLALGLQSHSCPLYTHRRLDNNLEQAVPDCVDAVKVRHATPLADCIFSPLTFALPPLPATCPQSKLTAFALAKAADGLTNTISY
jgi:hypothetical protein